MKFELRYAKNGCILEIDGNEYVNQEVEDDEIECFAGFLREILDNYGPQDSRYEAKRIHIIVKPGDKHPDWRGCPECGEYIA